MAWRQDTVDADERSGGGRGVFVVARVALTSVPQLFLSGGVDFDTCEAAALVFREREDPYERTAARVAPNRRVRPPVGLAVAIVPALVMRGATGMTVTLAPLLGPERRAAAVDPPHDRRSRRIGELVNEPAGA